MFSPIFHLKKFYYYSNKPPSATFSSYKFYRVTNHKPHGRSNPMAHKLIIFLNWRCRKKIFRNIEACLSNNSLSPHTRRKPEYLPLPWESQISRKRQFKRKIKSNKISFQNVCLAWSTVSGNIAPLFPHNIKSVI